jgi:hypothetical protein
VFSFITFEEFFNSGIARFGLSSNLCKKFYFFIGFKLQWMKLLWSQLHQLLVSANQFGF